MADLEWILTNTARKVLGSAAPLTPQDSLRECGLDSISIVEWMLALEKRGIRASYEQIAGAGTLRELAQLLAGQGETRDPKAGKDCRQPAARKLLRHLTEPVPTPKRRGFVVAVPYAGMGIQCFSALAQAFAGRGYELLACDVAGNCRSVYEMADLIAAEFGERRLKQGEELVVLGCCVGSALAIQLVKCFHRLGPAPVRLALVGSLPMSFLGDGDRKKLVWDLLPAPVTDLCLSALQGRRVRVTEDMLSRLRRDARNYVAWMTEQQGSPVETDTHLFFGSRDILTGGFRQKYIRWNRYLSGSVSVTELAGAYHFCLHSHGEEIAEQVAGENR